MPSRSGRVHVATTSRNYKGKLYQTHLLRRTFRVGHQVKHETLGNISHLPDSLIDGDPEAINKVFEAWGSAIDAFNAAFPDTALALNVSNPFNGGDGLARCVSEYAIDALGERATLQNNSLHAQTSFNFRVVQLLADRHDEGVRVGFQMLCASRNHGRFKGPFADALAIGDQVGATYFEIYQSDVKHLP